MASEFANPDKLDKDQIKALSHYLERLNELDAEAATRVTRYVIDNTDEDILLKLAGMKGAAAMFGLERPSGAMNYQLYSKHQSDRAAVSRVGAKGQPGPWVRLAHVFDAAVRAGSGAGTVPLTAPPGWPTWLVSFVKEAISCGYIGN